MATYTFFIDGVLGFIFSAILSIGYTVSFMERGAIEAGVAEYYLDEFHDRQFRYLSVKIDADRH